MENIVELINVTKTFKDFSINKMDLQVKKGFVTGFIGANGAGKSTTIKMMMNLLKPDDGEVKLFGMDYTTHEKAIKERIGFVYDGNVFFEGLNLKDIKHIVGPAYKRWDDTLFYQYVDKFELPLNKAIKTFSKGMQMKASLAIALSHHAELIIMDEPTAGLDPIFRRELLDILQELMIDNDRTIFFSTHITTDLDRIADYIAFMQGGNLVFNQSIHDIDENYALVKGGLDLLDKDTEKAFVHVRRASTGFEALTNNLSAVKNIFGDTVIIERATLEDIMYYMKGGVHYV
ncbi:ABC transporter ATP-binding protein [Halalkalibacterium halodurans]|uniref:ABC transporter (ATP-binding protein) n=1 Tax=Halalkalibacterium halodurans (strain ATCC BAA-125 / DSM 18197 / FERM 7344 / JCM 9153 / C-125) TaxID=272558 RepID=Q9KF34_HALH5|nr:ABC transporter ATP-binding protein [Halalkalibacterium halodurans]MDY7221146.1 ABC transporter ATP-binding protein [Halalkalibacterium halodurans]MDY7240385.1 ABC transporter ATP-binding protein [Halalkalibacterium halodurans]MED4082719.1 ABC transporter ATP-binding protein [Halalkalibacterium halodurans]MED4086645.1 ABC transporter ATP-binding protein [Halalkalibacterium halodurans]MED4103221.1 ABC transporter ATP-binding protein [Halalkalibacterium halodurans]